MTNYPRETADRFESAARSGQDFSDVYSSIVGMQQSSRDFNSYTMQMLATNMMLQQRGLADFDGDGNQDFILGAKNGMIFTADPTHQVIQARDRNFQVINEMELPMPPLDFESRGRTNCFPNIGDRLRREREERRSGCHEEISCCPPQCCCCACGERSQLKPYRGEGADMLGYPPFENGAESDNFSADEGVTDYSQFTGDGSMPANGAFSTYESVPADGTRPADGTLSSDGTFSTEGTLPSDGKVPTDATFSTDGTNPTDGTVESGESTSDLGSPPAFAPESSGKPYGMSFDGSTDGSVLPSETPSDGSASLDGGVPLDESVPSDRSIPTDQTSLIDPKS